MIVAAKNWLSPREAARELGVCSETVRWWCRQRRLAHYRVGSQIRIDRAALEAFLHRVDPVDSGAVEEED